MKKHLSLLLALLFLLPILPSFAPKEAVRVFALSGTTGFGMAPMMMEAEGQYEFYIEENTTVVRNALLSGEADIAALPTNLAATLYQATNGGVQVLAINTLGVLHLVTTEGGVSSLQDLEGKTVYTPSQNPAHILTALLAAAGVQNVTVDSTSYSKPKDLQKAVAGGLAPIAVLPEPLLTLAENATKGTDVTLTHVLDLTTEWERYYPQNSLVQGCVVVRSEFLANHPDLVSRFLSDYRASVSLLLNDPAAAAQTIAAVGLAPSAAVAAAALPRCHVTLLVGEPMKEALSLYLSTLPPASIGGALPGDDFYVGAS